MHQQRQRTQNMMNPPEDASDTGTPTGNSSLLRQAQQYAEVARQAREACQQGTKAEEELQRRRNLSGQ